MANKFTKVIKWAEENGYAVNEIRNGYFIKVSDTVSFRVEEKESTIYRSSRGGLKGNAAGSYLTISSPRFNNYCSRVSSQNEMIEQMETEAERFAVKAEAAAPAKKGKQPKNLQPILATLHKAFDLYNEQFFGGKLPQVVIAIRSQGKRVGVNGWFSVGKVWSDGTIDSHEIVLTAETINRPKIDILTTLMHEVIHLHCSENGIKETSRNGKYHNKTFVTEAEKFGFEYIHEKPDPTIGWSAITLTKETVAIVEKWDIDESVFGLARHQFGGEGEKPKKKSNIIKWVCPSCGATVRSSKFLGIKMACMNDKNADGTDKDACGCFFEPEIPENFNGKLTWDEPEEEEEYEVAEEIPAAAEPSEEDFTMELPPLESDEESSIYTDEKPVEEFHYDNQERRFNPDTCPTCPWFNEEEGSCRVHCSTIEYQNKIVNVYETRPLALDNPYENMKTCSHFEKYRNPRTTYKLDEVKGDN